MIVKTFHDIYEANKLVKSAAAELQNYLEAKSISNYQISHTVERDKYDRLHTHILLIHD